MVAASQAGEGGYDRLAKAGPEGSAFCVALSAMSKPLDLEKLRSVSVAGSAMPTRKGVVNETQQREERWMKDIPAYRRLRKDGLQPKTSNGAAELEARASERHEVEGSPSPALLERVGNSAS